MWAKQIAITRCENTAVQRAARTFPLGLQMAPRTVARTKSINELNVYRPMTDSAEAG